MKKNSSFAKNVFLIFSFVFLFASCTNLENASEIKSSGSSTNILKITLQTNARYISAYEFEWWRFSDWTLTLKDENNKNTTLSLSDSDNSAKTNSASLSYSNETFIASNIPIGTYTITLEGTYTQSTDGTTYTITGSKTGIEIVQNNTTETSLYLGLKKSSNGYGGLSLSLKNADSSNYFSNISNAEAKLTSRSGETNYSTKDDNAVLSFDTSSYLLSADNGKIASGWYSLSFTLDGYNFTLSDTEIEIADGLTTAATISVTATTSKTYYATNEVATGNGYSASSRANLATLLENLSERLPSEQGINIYVNGEPEIDLYTLGKLESKLADNKNENRTVTIYNATDSEAMRISVTYKSDEGTYTGSVESISNSVTLIGSTVDETDYKTIDIGQIDTTQVSFTITLVDGAAINLTSTEANYYLTNTLGINAVTAEGTENLSAYYDMPFITFNTNSVDNKMFDVNTGYGVSYTENDGTYAYFITYVTMKTGSELNETLTFLTKNYSGDTLSFKAYAGDTSNVETSNKLSSDDSKTPCYVWFDSDSSTVYCYAKGYAGSEGTHLILLNEDSSQMFEECSFTEIDMSGFSAKNVTCMSDMFFNCKNLTTLNIKVFDTSNVNSMNNMFQNCSVLETLDLTNFDTSKVTTMDSMFYNCNSLKNLNISKFDTSNVTEMEQMFENCSGLTSLDLSSFDTSKVTEMTLMFNGCSSLTTIYAASDADWSDVSQSEKMFDGCTNLVGGNKTTYNSSNVDATYARIDTADTPGYFTDITKKASSE